MTKLTNDKAPGLNKVLPNDFKALNGDNLTNLLDFFNEYWLEKTDLDEWHEVQIVPVPKIGALSDPKKWRDITLMDIASKELSSILYERSFKIIKAHGVKYQFGSTPGVVCQYGSFTLNILLHLQKTTIYPVGLHLQIW